MAIHDNAHMGRVPSGNLDAGGIKLLLIWIFPAKSIAIVGLLIISPECEISEIAYR